MSGSDDFTMFLWEPSTSKAPIARMTGHMQLINQVSRAAIKPLTSAAMGLLCLCCLCCQPPASDLSRWRPCHSSRALRHTAQVQFSPDGRWIVSASFDKALKLWDGLKGTFVATFRGHVGPVYQVAWSSDSRLFVSGSKDSTLKVMPYRLL